MVVDPSASSSKDNDSSSLQVVVRVVMVLDCDDLWWFQWCRGGTRRK